jgi:RND family efflux transporter MFP subunit
VKVQNGDKVKKGQIIVLLDDSATLADLSLARAEVRDQERQLATTMNLFKAQAATTVDVGKARGQVEIARAKLRPIEARLDQAKIRMPVDGTILEVLLNTGEAVQPNAAVVKVADLSQLMAEVDINEADLVKIRRDQAVDVTSDAFPDKQYKGVVREIAGTADKAKGTVTVRVDLQVPDLSLRPDMSVKCSFLPDQGEKARIFVSRSSLTPEGTVWIVGSSRVVTKRAVKTQAGAGNSVEVIEGLTGGERIVVDAGQVHEGQTLPPD